MEDTTTALTLTLFISILLGLLGLIAFMWGLRSGQFDDEKRFTHGALFDGEDELNAARDREEKLKNAASGDPSGSKLESDLSNPPNSPSKR
ncbi:MAG: cbb3-type cytochrome oxidase assembly protein CcoS [Helicobacteraceae bacterium]|jgi:cbb3-type cytochrome oxidase maturation protein|nr:cbb3-type cytochrome oxidase assembly protein CcoS [Helicobacteraceae bacterium]